MRTQSAMAFILGGRFADAYAGNPRGTKSSGTNRCYYRKEREGSRVFSWPVIHEVPQKEEIRDRDDHTLEAPRL